MNLEELRNQSQADFTQMIEDRRYLHTHPGTGFEIEDTVEYVKKTLEKMGYEPKSCGKAGLVALAGGKRPGKVFLLRADMDALPMKEEAEVSCPSQNGRMHACGHDMHTTMLLEAARLLKVHEDEIQGTVKLMFQPAEEIFEGSHDMIKAGVLKNPDVDAGMMIHVMAGVPFPEGSVVIAGAGVSAPAADIFEIRVQGKGCHGSSPSNGIDPLNAAAHILIALQELNARELGLSEQAALTIGQIEGGTAPNVIPDSVVLRGSLRTYDEDTRAYLKERMEEMSSHVAAAFRAQVEVTFPSGCPTLVNDPALCQKAEQYLTELLGAEKVFTTEKLSAQAAGNSEKKEAEKAMTPAARREKKNAGGAGSEDFAYVSHEIPTVMVALAAGTPANGYRYPQHHPQVKFANEVLPVGSTVYAYMAIKWLEDQISG